MKNFSVYRYHNMTLNELETIVNSLDEWAKKEVDPITEKQLQFEYQLIEKINVTVDGKNVEALYLEFRNAKLSEKHRNNPNDGKRIRKNDSDIVVFEEDNDVIIIPLRGKNTTTGSLIRTAFNINEDNRLVSEDFPFSEDFFYWLFNHYLNNSGKIVNSEERNRKLKIISLTGFSGETRDKVNKITSDGNRISKILWTLAFLFTNEKLMSITPELEHSVVRQDGPFSEIIKLDLTLTGTYKIGVTDHIGSRFLERKTNRSLVYLILYTYMILIPELLAAYRNDRDCKSWSPHIKKQFIMSIGSEIEAQVTQILDEIESELVRF